MNNIEEETRLIMELARLLISKMQSMGKPWRKAFLRSEIAEDMCTLKGSFILGDAVYLFDELQHKAMFSTARAIVPQVREASANGGRRFCVALLIVDSDFNYEMKYEYDDANSWEISKLGGRSGVPQGIGTRFQDTYVNSAERFSVGQELDTGRFYLSIPVSNRLADYEEYYEISREAHDRYPHNPAELSGFAEKCRRRECDHLLFIKPGSDRGVA
jgi:hypothetical protein